MDFHHRGFGKDLSQQHELKFHMDSVTFAGPYTVNGKILILPVTGKGVSNITLGTKYSSRLYVLTFINVLSTSSQSCFIDKF